MMMYRPSGYKFRKRWIPDIFGVLYYHRTAYISNPLLTRNPLHSNNNVYSSLYVSLSTDASSRSSSSSFLDRTNTPPTVMPVSYNIHEVIESLLGETSIRLVHGLSKYPYPLVNPVTTPTTTTVSSLPLPNFIDKWIIRGLVEQLGKQQKYEELAYLTILYLFIDIDRQELGTMYPGLSTITSTKDMYKQKDNSKAQSSVNYGTVSRDTVIPLHYMDGSSISTLHRGMVWLLDGRLYPSKLSSISDDDQKVLPSSRKATSMLFEASQTDIPLLTNIYCAIHILQALVDGKVALPVQVMDYVMRKISRSGRIDTVQSVLGIYQQNWKHLQYEQETSTRMIPGRYLPILGITYALENLVFLKTRTIYRLFIDTLAQVSNFGRPNENICIASMEMAAIVGDIESILSIIRSAHYIRKKKDRKHVSYSMDTVHSSLFPLSINNNHNEDIRSVTLDPVRIGYYFRTPLKRKDETKLQYTTYVSIFRSILTALRIRSKLYFRLQTSNNVSSTEVPFLSIVERIDKQIHVLFQAMHEHGYTADNDIKLLLYQIGRHIQRTVHQVSIPLPTSSSLPSLATVSTFPSLFASTNSGSSSTLLQSSSTENTPSSSVASVLPLRLNPSNVSLGSDNTIHAQNHHRAFINSLLLNELESGNYEYSVIVTKYVLDALGLVKLIKTVPSSSVSSTDDSWSINGIVRGERLPAASLSTMAYEVIIRKRYPELLRLLAPYVTSVPSSSPSVHLSPSPTLCVTLLKCLSTGADIGTFSSLSSWILQQYLHNHERLSAVMLFTILNGLADQLPYRDQALRIMDRLFLPRGGEAEKHSPRIQESSMAVSSTPMVRSLFPHLNYKTYRYCMYLLGKDEIVYQNTNNEHRLYRLAQNIFTEAMNHYREVQSMIRPLTSIDSSSATNGWITVDLAPIGTKNQKFIDKNYENQILFYYNPYVIASTMIEYRIYNQYTLLVRNKKTMNKGGTMMTTIEMNNFHDQWLEKVSESVSFTRYVVRSLVQNKEVWDYLVTTLPYHGNRGKTMGLLPTYPSYPSPHAHYYRTNIFHNLLPGALSSVTFRNYIEEYLIELMKSLRTDTHLCVESVPEFSYPLQWLQSLSFIHTTVVEEEKEGTRAPYPKYTNHQTVRKSSTKSWTYLQLYYWLIGKSKYRTLSVPVNEADDDETVFEYESFKNIEIEEDNDDDESSTTTVDYTSNTSDKEIIFPSSFQSLVNTRIIIPAFQAWANQHYDEGEATTVEKETEKV